MAAPKTSELFLQMVLYTKLGLEMHCLNNYLWPPATHPALAFGKRKSAFPFQEAAKLCD